MDGYAANPDLIRYLQGEISFETWLEQQSSRNDSHENQTARQQPMSANSVAGPAVSQMTTDEPGSMFSSWGNAFTSSLGTQSENQDDLQSSYLLGNNETQKSTTSKLGSFSRENANNFEDRGAEEIEEEIFQLGKDLFTWNCTVLLLRLLAILAMLM